MKKIVLSLLVVGSLLATSCKEAKKGATDLKDATVETAGKAADATTEAAGAVAEGAKEAAGTVAEGATDAANAVVEGAENAVEGVKDAVSDAKDSALAGITIPSFSNEAVTKNLTEYAAYAKDYIAANGNLAKISALAPKGAALLAKGKELASKLDAKEMAKYKSVLSAIQSKMAPSK
ncbi:hypothetical protein [Polaribacter butkevichii]|uniref:Uncharacterized protein n=1 Tax=Polaribacter butkevichii TaxID=218490 RepID=A0A2P6CAD3_9FLAO|nr:hypothetical protein [Polaribacter butkevichii]PQJ71884.1 hypothetical protein BTO14_00840 [Polaribacter butkevichii]